MGSRLLPGIVSALLRGAVEITRPTGFHGNTLFRWGSLDIPCRRRRSGGSQVRSLSGAGAGAGAGDGAAGAGDGTGAGEDAAAGAGPDATGSGWFEPTTGGRWRPG